MSPSGTWKLEVAPRFLEKVMYYFLPKYFLMPSKFTEIFLKMHLIPVTKLSIVPKAPKLNLANYPTQNSINFPYLQYHY